MIEKLDMNICTEAPKENVCMSCKKVNTINHHIVAEKSIITICSNCLEKLCITGIERLGYKKINILNRKIYMKGKEKWQAKENTMK